MTIYLVRRHDGTFMRYGAHWGDMKGATAYTKPVPAKSRITTWARLHPNEPHPTLLAWVLTEDTACVMDLSEDTTKALNRIQRRKLERAKIAAAYEIETLTRQHAEIQQRLTTLQTS